jgi:hypothetical protein
MQALFIVWVVCGCGVGEVLRQGSVPGASPKGGSQSLRKCMGWDRVSDSCRPQVRRSILSLQLLLQSFQGEWRMVACPGSTKEAKLFFDQKTKKDLKTLKKHTKKNTKKKTNKKKQKKQKQ